MSTATVTPLEWDEGDLLVGHDVAEPLVAGGVRCHGGFASDGTYLSPRTAYRVPAIAAWEAQRHATFGTAPLDADLATWPRHYPNVAQARLLLEHGVTAPIVALLTRIGTIEGFGGMIRLAPQPDLQQLFADDLTGTASAHLRRGLFEAHARDEAGFEDEGGHKQMWFAARDIAFQPMPSTDEVGAMLARMGVLGPGQGGGPGRAPAAAPAWPWTDVDPDLQALVGMMAGLMLIEISAFHSFAWAEEVLGDTGLVAGDGDAARLVSYIRADETPHVAYLRTSLSEMRDRRVRTLDGRTRAGAEVVGAIWDRALAVSRGERRALNLAVARGEVVHALAGRAGGADLLAHFDDLGDVRPGPAGAWVTATSEPA